ncbi:hypothetical protein F8388_026209 [Cannabis sativa]|uniref:Retrotransposon Copia-like N-terminal domain-containing protein n=1 Tax=Cannabis sativa TaxID=3483 RepID=A0A7J6DUE3_CANSA|nr:hypothetical protein F8388_026209 [Cannabis sativa]
MVSGNKRFQKPKKKLAATHANPCRKSMDRKVKSLANPHYLLETFKTPSSSLFLSRQSFAPLIHHDASSIDTPIVTPAINPPIEPHQQNLPPVHRPAHEDSSNPYYLSSSDHPDLILVTPPLSDHNFQPRRRDFELSVGARNKTAFLKGTLPSPPEIDPLHNHWTRCNQMVMTMH